MLKNMAILLTIGSIATGAFAQTITDIHAKTGDSAYLQDNRGVIVRSANGMCWHTAYWTPADAVAGCDGQLMPPVPKAIAPDLPAAPPPVATAPIAPQRCDFTVELASDQAFAFNQTILNDAAKKRIDTDVINKLAGCAKVDIITITGHSDRLGATQYNRKLSEKRAHSVADYLKSKGIAVPIKALGTGESQPIHFCNDQLRRKQLIDCLTPNRRVVIEAQGIAK
jgi:OmpA-OmpF porin, OOP family